jgi:hypothetical protein
MSKGKVESRKMQSRASSNEKGSVSLYKGHRRGNIVIIRRHAFRARVAEHDTYSDSAAAS